MRFVSSDSQQVQQVMISKRFKANKRERVEPFDGEVKPG